MSESIDHRSLVVGGVKHIISKYPNVKFVSDVQDKPSDPIPFLIGGYRPDIYATDLSQDAEFSFIIAEAKTDHDIDNSHTESQVKAFIDYLEQREKGQLILLTTGVGSRRAKSMLRFVHEEVSIRYTQVSIFDTLELWHYNGEAQKWHLG